jgi:drug/metabolite transporter (DMT)-like permease
VGLIETEDMTNLRLARALPIIALVVVQFIYGFNYAAAKVILASYPPILWGAERMLIAAVLMFGIAWGVLPKSRRVLNREFILFTLLLGTVGLALNQAFFLMGLKYSTTTNSAILNSMVPLFTLFFAILMGSEKFTWVRALSFLMAVSGAFVIHDFNDFQITSDTFKGDLLTLLNCACLALFFTLSQKFLKKHSPVWATAWMFLFASAVLFAMAYPDWGHWVPDSLGPHFGVAAFYNIVFATMLAYFLNSWTLTKVSPSLVAVFVYFQPVIAVFNAWLSLGESPNLRTYLAMLLIFTGVGIGARRKA